MRRSRENWPRRKAGRFRSFSGRAPASRAGLATLDYVLILGVVLPLAAFVLWIGPRIMRLAYEMVCVLVSGPLM